MDIPEISEDNIEMILDRKFVRVADIEYAPGRHYFDATRHTKDELTVLKSDEEFRTMKPDAVTCFVIINTPGKGAELLLTYEYRYPVGRFLLSPPAGLIDEADRNREDAVLVTAAREIKEETGLVLRDTDRLFTVSPLVFSSPGLTDENNALVCAVLDDPDLSSLSQEGAEGSECFDGFVLASRDRVMEYLSTGRDDHGNFYSAYTWAAMMYFISGLWEVQK